MNPTIIAVLTFCCSVSPFAVCEDDTAPQDEWKFAAVTLKYRGLMKGLVKDEPGQPLYLDYGSGPVRFARSLVMKIEDLRDDEWEEVMAKVSLSPKSKAIAEALYVNRMKAAGKVLFNGNWLTPEDAKAEEERLAAEAKRREEERIAAEKAVEVKRREEAAKAVAWETAEAKRREEQAKIAAAARRREEQDRIAAEAPKWREEQAAREQAERLRVPPGSPPLGSKEWLVETYAKEAGTDKETMREELNRVMKDQGLWQWSKGGF